MNKKLVAALGVCLLIIAFLAGMLFGRGQNRGNETDVAVTEDSGATAETTGEEGETPEEPAEEVEQDDSLIPILPELSEPEPDVSHVGEQGGRLNIVYFGDSQFEVGSADQKDIPYFVGQYTSSNTYNLAIGGTCASLTVNDSSDFNNWDNCSFYGMANMLAGRIPLDVLEGRYQKTIMEAIDPAEVDYYVISYGVNDFLNGRQAHIQGQESVPYNYHGALTQGIAALADVSPNAQFILCTPAYTQFFNKAGVYLGDSHIHDYGIGVFDQYATQVQHIARGKYLVLDAAFDTMFNLNSTNAQAYLMDGIHLTERGRNVYALALSYLIAKDQGWTTQELGRIDIDNLDASIGFLSDIPGNE
ncbi:MAG: SGNH/GDSL hydrolase family protein [Lachnospiraceae bacterium]|nr:SGNH/GDSL hydrolase family protein [Lachnospiraceae bacterium]